MASIVSCAIGEISGRESGSRPNVYEAVWNVVVDDQVDTKELLRLARAVAPSATETPIPLKGDYYSYTSPGGVRSEDKSALALDFTPRSTLDDMKVFSISVTWRPPVPGAEEEYDVVSEHPLLRLPYWWVEYYTETEQVFNARLPRGFKLEGAKFIGQGSVQRDIGEEGPITTAAGEEVDLAVDERLHMVLVCERNIIGPIVAAIINSKFFGTINRNQWRLPRSLRAEALEFTTTGGRAVIPHHARFLRAESGQYGEWWDGDQYFKMQVRVRTATLPFYKRVPNRGTWEYDTSASQVRLIRDTDAVIGKKNLTVDGVRSDTNTPLLIPYQISDDVTFNRGMGFDDRLPRSLVEVG